MSAPLIVSPRGDALVKRPSVRVVVRRRAGARTRVRLGRRDVTFRFRVRGGRLVGRLRRSDGLRLGRNHLAVVSKSRGRRRAARHVRSFFRVRRQNGFARVRLRGRTPRLRIDFVSGAPRLQLARRSRLVRVRLNGRSLTRELLAPTGTRRTVSLSASHGLRHGVNRLRVFVAEPRAGRFAFAKRRFVVRRTQPLAAAGRDRAAQPGMRVRLGGRARAARRGRLKYRWSLVRRPKGSRARIRGRTRKRPSLRPDRPGRYVVRQRVFEHKGSRGRASASRVMGASFDDASLAVSPADGLFGFSSNAFPVDFRGIKLGNSKCPPNSASQPPGCYHHPGPGSTMQWLMVDRATLLPAKTGNTWCCGDGENSLDTLRSALDNAGVNQLVVITRPPNEGTLGPSQYDDFNRALAKIGVKPLDDDDFGTPMTIVGVPSGRPGSGWVIRSPVSTEKLPTQGWLMPEGDLSTTSTGQRLRFQPLRQPFDTSSASTATTNTMKIAGKTVQSDQLGGAPGFHVVEVDPRDMRVVGNVTFNAVNSNNGTGNEFDMADVVNEARARRNYVAVQSFGSFSPPNNPKDPQWTAAREALVAMGANPHYWNYPAKRYAFFGGPPLTRRDVAQSNSSIVADPTVPANQPGWLKGNARMRPDGYFTPTGSSPSDGPADSLYETVFTTSKPWPYTAEAGDPDAAAYERAMKYITGELIKAPSGDDFAQFPDDIRLAYLGAPDYDGWGKAQTNLEGIHYPGLGAGSCNNAPNPNNQPGFTLTQFCKLKATLSDEFGWLVDSKMLTDNLKAAFIQAGGKQQGELRSIADPIKTAVDPPNSDVASALLYMLQSAADLADLIELAGAPEVAAFAGLAASTYDLTTALGNDDGTPIGDQIATEVDDLGADIADNVSNAQASIDNIRGAAVSNYGRLSALAQLARDNETNTITNVADHLATAGGRYFSSELVASLLKTPQGSYHSWEVLRYFLDGKKAPAPEDCHDDFEQLGGHDAPKGAWVPFLADPAFWSSLAFGDFGGFWSDYPPGGAPPNDIMETMFRSTSRSGYGVEKTTWFWTYAGEQTGQGGIPDRLDIYQSFDDC